MKQRHAVIGIDLNRLFDAETAPLALRVLTAVDNTPTASYSAFELLEAAQVESPMNGLLILARLASSGLLAHPGEDEYTSTDDGLRVVAAARAA